ncbi:MAG: type VI secretion system baseplate subunit TssF [Cystobacter sp.]
MSQSTQKDELLQAYQRELAWLRGAGAEFAASYPQQAERLRLGAHETGDPHVERLIESFAFLTARVQHAFDRDLPELSSSLLEQLAPHLVQPRPSLSIACFEPDPGISVPPGGHVIERGTQLLASVRTGQTCRFRTCAPVRLWPVRVTEAEQASPLAWPWLRTERGVSSVLRLRLETQGMRWPELALKRLRFFLDAPGEIAFPVHEWLMSAVRGVAFVPGGAPPTTPAPILPADHLRAVGFGPEEAVLDTPSHAHPGYRLLQEYFALPEKFLFHELEVDRACREASEHTLEVLVLLDVPRDENLALTPEMFRLGCTPIINLFPKLAEPLRLDHRRTEYPLVPDYRRQEELELHSLVSVTASSPDTERTRVVEPLFSWRHASEDGEPRAFWYTRRQPTGLGAGRDSRVVLSFVDLDLDPRLPAEQTLQAHTLCTNGRLPVQLAPGAELRFEEHVPVASIRCLRRPTAPRSAPEQGPSLWRLVSLLSLNHLSLVGGERALESLQELLRLHDGSEQSVGEQRIRGLTRLACRPVTRPLRDGGWRGFCRGLEVTLTFDTALYEGNSALLLGAVLSHFFGQYSAVDSFTQLVAKREQKEGVWKQWPPMTGARPLL